MPYLCLLMMETRTMPRTLAMLLTLLGLLAAGRLAAQSESARAVRDSIHAFNNAAQFQRSQALLLEFLRRPDITEDDRFHAHL